MKEYKANNITETFIKHIQNMIVDNKKETLNTKLQELLKCNSCAYFTNNNCTNNNCLTKNITTQIHNWTKQQTTNEIIYLTQHWILEHNYIDIFELEDYIKQQTQYT